MRARGAMKREKPDRIVGLHCVLGRPFPADPLRVLLVFLVMFRDLKLLSDASSIQVSIGLLMLTSVANGSSGLGDDSRACMLRRTVRIWSAGDHLSGGIIKRNQFWRSGKRSLSIA